MKLSETHHLSLFLLHLTIILISCDTSNGKLATVEDYPKSHVKDKNTVLLWLFDEEAYPNATITDASQYEIADLRLTSATLSKGKFGNALPSTAVYNVIYAGYPGQGALVPRQPDGVPTGLWGPTYAPEDLLHALSAKDLTVEFWLNLTRTLTQDAFIVDMGRGFDPGFAVRFSGQGKNLAVRNFYRGIESVFEIPDLLSAPDEFLHIAIQIDKEGKGLLFLDGRPAATAEPSLVEKSPLPPIESPRDNFEDGRNWADLSEDQKKRQRFNVSLLQDRNKEHGLMGALDEFRVSDVLRFDEEGFVPGTYSRNYSDDAYSIPSPSGPPLLLSREVLENYDPVDRPLDFGKRKYLFLDDKILETVEHAQVIVKPVHIQQAEKTDIEKIDGEWRITFAQDGERKLGIATANYNSSRGLVYLYETQNGLQFEGKAVDMVNYPMGGDLFIDDSPESQRNGTRFKLTAYLSGRGIYLYTSADAMHWQRNETSALPLLSGGSAESFYDDQQGKYVMYLKRDASFDNPEAVNPRKRVSVRFETKDPYRVWPFKKMTAPYFEYAPFPVVTGEGESQFILPHGAPAYEQVYRTRVIKYPYAPDTYLAFPWIYQANSDDRDVAIAHSRDGDDWEVVTDPYYLDKGDYREVISCQGLHRNGDELWQYFELGDAHGSGERTWYRVRRRLDGFFALQSGEISASAITKTMVVDGDNLQVNYVTTDGGSLSVEVLDEMGHVISGFSKNECVTLTGDDTAAEVKWKNAQFTTLAGKKIKLKFHLNNTELYAFETL